MQTSEKGIALIKQFEGCKLTAYPYWRNTVQLSDFRDSERSRR
ncbi:hypothetical protein [Enterobacter asburiae]|nr:hypothetical protein [Enterobacter asburiae]